MRREDVAAGRWPLSRARIAEAFQTRRQRIACWLYDSRVDIAVVTAITLLAAVLRIWRVDTIPLGLHGDEAWTGLDARRVLHEGWIGAYVASAVGQPTGPLYFTALLFKVMPQTTFTLRFSMALFGVATIPLAYATFASMFNRTVGAFSSLILAVMMWHLHLSRTGFMVISWPCVEMAALLAMWHAIRLRSLALFVVAGSLTGLGMYTYNAFYLFFPLPFVALVWGYPPQRGRVPWRPVLHIAGFVAAALIVSLPLLLYIAHNTDDYRFHQKLVSITDSNEWRQADGLGEHAHLIWDRADELQSSLLHGGRTDYGDGLATQGHPPLGRLTAVLAMMGFVAAIWNWRKASYAVVLAAIVVMPWGALLTVGDGLFRRTLGITPFIALLAALPLAAAWEQSLRWQGRARYAAALVLFLPVYTGATTVYQYFGPVQDDAEFRLVYPYQMDAASHYISGLPKGTFVYFLSANWSFDYETRRFIAPDAIGVDRSREFRDLSRDPTFDPIDFTANTDRSFAFVLLDAYRDDLEPLADRYPGGTLTEVTRGPELLFRGYYLPRSE